MASQHQTSMLSLGAMNIAGRMFNTPWKKLKSCTNRVQMDNSWSLAKRSVCSARMFSYRARPHEASVVLQAWDITGASFTTYLGNCRVYREVEFMILGKTKNLFWQECSPNSHGNPRRAGSLEMRKIARFPFSTYLGKMSGLLCTNIECNEMNKTLHLLWQ